MSDVTLTISARDLNAVKKFIEIRGAARDVGAEIEAIDKKGSKAKQSVGAMATGMAANMGRVAATFVGVGSALAAVSTAARLIMAEAEQYRSRRAEAAVGVVGMAESNQNLIQMAASSAPAGRGVFAARRAQKAAARISETYGVDQAKINNALAGAYSAIGTLPESVAEAAVEAAAQLSPQSQQEEFNALSTGVLDLLKAYSPRNIGSMPKEELLRRAREQVGMIITGAGVSRGETIRDFTKNMIPAVSQLKGYGATEAEAIALGSAISQQGADVDMRISANSMIQAAEQVLEATSNISELQGATLGQRRDWLRSDDKRAGALRHGMMGKIRRSWSRETKTEMRRAERMLRRKDYRGLKELHGEAKARMSIMGWIDPELSADLDDYYAATNDQGIPISAMYEQFLPQVTAEAAMQRVEELQHALGESSIQKTAALDRSIKAAAQHAQARQPGMAAKGVLLENLPILQRALGQSAFFKTIQSFADALAPETSVEDAFTLVQQRLDEQLLNNLPVQYERYIRHRKDGTPFVDLPTGVTLPRESQPLYDAIQAWRGIRQRYNAVETRADVPYGQSSFNPLRNRSVIGELLGPEKPNQPPREPTRFEGIMGINPQPSLKPQPVAPSSNDQSSTQNIDLRISIADPMGREISRSVARLLPIRRMTIG